MVSERGADPVQWDRCQAVMNEIPFEVTFQALTGHPRFPWQRELFERFIKGQVERAVDIPTGLGKTAVMAIWLIARANRTSLPRRLVYVVDRRAVVDQATAVAVGIRDAVDQIPELKNALQLGDRSLPISTLRGQHVDNKEWLADPASPAIIVGTIDMVGSRLLFEGYGVSRKMRPYHAGLLGADTLVVLDEAHLVPPFECLLDAIATDEAAFAASGEESRSLIPPFKLMSLSATARTRSGGVFGLTKADLNHEIVLQRLNAVKRLSLVPLPDDKELPEALAEEAWKITQDGSLPVRVIVFCDKRKVAEDAKKVIEKMAKGDKEKEVPPVEIDTDLFVGGRRVYERESAAARLAELGFIAGKKVALPRPAFLFATSAGEVGVDLDADHMVSDLVEWERMVQRLGRVNRRGEGRAKVVVVLTPDPKPTKVVEAALEKEEEELSDKERKSIAKHRAEVERSRAIQKPFDRLPLGDEGWDASPGAIRDLKQKAETDIALRTVIEAATTPVPLRPALTRPLVDAWSMTSLKEHAGRPKVDPWLRGWVEDDPQSKIVWRKYLPVRSGGAVRQKEIEAFFEAAPPHVSEILETETDRTLEWMTARAKAFLKRAGKRTGSDPAGMFERGHVVAMVLSPSGGLRRSLTLNDCLFEDKRTNSDRKDELRRELSGATVIVDARWAGLSPDGLLDNSHDLPPRTADDGEAWLSIPGGEPVVRFRIRLSTPDTQDLGDSKQWRTRLRFPTVVSAEGEPDQWLTVEKWRTDSTTEEDRSVGRPQLLVKHQELAETRIRELAAKLDLPQEYVRMLAFAARFHDEGKKAVRWQRAFNAPKDGIYAKTVGPLNVALLDGYRHEFRSLAVAAGDAEFLQLSPDLQELALHLIAAHHGFGRPVIGVNGCDDAPPSVLERRARDVAVRFACLQRRWGPWGLAWWEALLRAADHQASRENDEEES